MRKRSYNERKINYKQYELNNVLLHKIKDNEYVRNNPKSMS